MRDYPAGMPCKERKQLKFPGRQFHLGIGTSDAMTDAVDFDVVGSKYRCLRFPFYPVSKRRPHARQEFSHTEWLVDKIVCSKVQRLDLLCLAVACRQDNDRYIGPFPHPADHVLAVAIGEPKIENHNFGSISSNTLDRFRDATGDRYLEIIGIQGGIEESQNGRFVIDDENA